ncbi:MAG: hypothetical protein WBO46_17135, partial [Caldilineaceae bacterium]
MYLRSNGSSRLGNRQSGCTEKRQTLDHQSGNKVSERKHNRRAKYRLKVIIHYRLPNILTRP